MARAGLSDERAREVTIDLDRAMELRDGLGVAREAADLRPRISAGLATFRTLMTSRERPRLLVIEDIQSSTAPASRSPPRPGDAGRRRRAPDPDRPARGAPPPAVDAVIALDDLSGADCAR